MFFWYQKLKINALEFVSILTCHCMNTIQMFDFHLSYFSESVTAFFLLLLKHVDAHGSYCLFWFFPVLSSMLLAPLFVFAVSIERIMKWRRQQLHKHHVDAFVCHGFSHFWFNIEHQLNARQVYFLFKKNVPLFAFLLLFTCNGANQNRWSSAVSACVSAFEKYCTLTSESKERAVERKKQKNNRKKIEN